MTSIHSSPTLDCRKGSDDTKSVHCPLSPTVLTACSVSLALAETKSMDIVIHKCPFSLLVASLFTPSCPPFLLALAPP